MSDLTADRAALARVCPLPTDPGRLALIADYLTGAPADPGLDALATEFERLDDGARLIHD